MTQRIFPTLLYSAALSCFSLESGYCRGETLPLKEELPRWDLSDLYKGMTDPILEKDLKELESQVQEFSKKYKGCIIQLSGKDLAQAIQAFESIEQKARKIISFGHLLYATHTNDPQVGSFFQGIREKITQMASTLCFFKIELAKRDDLLTLEEVKKYRPWLHNLLDQKPHQLNVELEQLMTEKSLSASQAWVRLYDETLAALRFEVGSEKDLPLSHVLNKLQDSNPETRKSAAQSLTKVLKESLPLFSMITNTLAQDKSINDRWHKFEKPIDARNLDNQVENEVVQALVTAVRKNYKDLTHRYYALKARMFGQKTLPWWDRNAPFPGHEETTISWPEATKIVLKAYEDFSPLMAEKGRLFVEKRWIDVPPVPGKNSGAFACSIPGVHPYLLLNYHGKLSDVKTLGHEMGHGIHMILSDHNGALMADTPLTLAETASIFGEMLTFQACLARAKDDEEKKYLLAHKIEDMLNTVVRQIGLHLFEERVHEERRKGEISSDRLCEIWTEVQKENLGNSVILDENYRVLWSYISHFIHSPFYVYSYAFADCLVNSLFVIYQSLPAEEKKEFVKKYEKMLQAGGTLRHKELLAPFGLDATDPTFWDKGLSLIHQMIDQLESIVEKEEKAKKKG